jgi:hypothetical protein
LKHKNKSNFTAKGGYFCYGTRRNSVPEFLRRTQAGTAFRNLFPCIGINNTSLLPLIFPSLFAFYLCYLCKVYRTKHVSTYLAILCIRIYAQDIHMLCGCSYYTAFLVREYFLHVCHKHNQIKLSRYRKIHNYSKISVAVSVAFTCVPILRIRPPIVNLPRSEYNVEYGSNYLCLAHTEAKLQWER